MACLHYCVCIGLRKQHLPCLEAVCLEKCWHTLAYAIRHIQTSEDGPAASRKKAHMLWSSLLQAWPVGIPAALRVSLLSVLSGDAGEQGILPGLVYGLDQALVREVFFHCSQACSVPNSGCCDLCNSTEEAMHPHASASLPSCLEEPTLPHYAMGSNQTEGSRY